MKDTINQKKRIMFVTGGDYYFFVYNLLIILYELNAHKGKFKDHRKLTYLIDFVSDLRYIDILERVFNHRMISTEDVNILKEEYSLAQCRMNEITKLLLALEQRSIVALERSKKDFCLDVSLNNKEEILDFLKSDQFFEERKNTQRIRRWVPRLKQLKIETFVDKIFKNHGINTWLH